MLEINKTQHSLVKANITSMYTSVDEIEKAEGSRGGKVIGHTKSGRPIYEEHSDDSVTQWSILGKTTSGKNVYHNSYNRQEYKDFTPEDHKEALEMHQIKHKYHNDERKKILHKLRSEPNLTQPEVKNLNSLKNHHNSQLYSKDSKEGYHDRMSRGEGTIYDI